MDAVTQIILADRKLTYCITDTSFTIEAIDNPAAPCWHETPIGVGASLLEAVPELIGSEDVLQDILNGKLARWELARINRETAGETRYFTFIELPNLAADGTITGLIHLAQEVTEGGQIEQRLAQHRNDLRLLQAQLASQNQELAAKNVALQKLDEIKSMFVSVAAHELRTPLTIITGFVKLLLSGKSGPLVARQHEHLQIIHDSAQRMLELINNLLDVSRIETERIDLALKPTDIVTLIRNAMNELQPALQAKTQTLHFEPPAQSFWVLCDPARTMQILLNLLSNASKYTFENGAISVRLEPAVILGMAQIAVTDTGVGIPLEDHPKLFTRFFRAQTATLTNASGTGLGLYITRSLVELHGGQLWFESQLGIGTTFYFTLPLAAAQ